MANSQPSLCDSLLRDESVDTRFDGEEQVFLIDRQHLIHCAHIDQNLIRGRLDATTNPAAQTPGNDRDVVSGGIADYCLNVCSVPWADDASGGVQGLPLPVLPVL